MRHPYQLYLLVDEYDNFANEIVTDDEEVYHQLVKSDGPFKYLFKWVKGLMGGAGLDRLFITGVSPMVMADVTSGMNIARNVYLKPALADLCGFSEDRSYVTHSEPELDHRYADLCLLRRPDARTSTLWDLLFEFKRLPLGELGQSGQEVKAASRSELMKLPEVKAALDEAEAQVAEYRAALERRRGETLKLRSYAVVALVFERLVVRAL